MSKRIRRKGEGSLFNKNGYWYVRWMVNGKVYTKSTGTKSYREAQKRQKKIVAPFASRREEEAIRAFQRKLEGISRRRYSFDEAWTEFSECRHLASERDETLQKGRWRKFVAWMSENHPAVTSIDGVDKYCAMGFLNSLDGSIEPKTYNEYKALFAQVWSELKESAGLTNNPWKSIKSKHTKGSTIPQRKLTNEELEKLVQFLKHECSSEIRRFFLLGIYTGQRSNDCAHLDWKNVDFKANRIILMPHKTANYGTTVRIPIFPGLKKELERTPSDKRDGLLLPNIADQFDRRQSTVSRWIRETFEGAGIETYGSESRHERRVKEVGFHSLRHTFVSVCALHGVPISIVQAIVGHSSPRMTEEYAQVNDKDLDRILDVFPSFDGNDGDTKKQKAIEAFKVACDGLLAAGLTQEEWKNAASLFFQPEQKQKALLLEKMSA